MCAFEIKKKLYIQKKLDNRELILWKDCTFSSFARYYLCSFDQIEGFPLDVPFASNKSSMHTSAELLHNYEHCSMLKCQCAYFSPTPYFLST